MVPDDRVVSTALLARCAGRDGGMLCVPAPVLARCGTDALHLLVLEACTRVRSRPVAVCTALLDTGGPGPLRVPVLVPLKAFEALPTAFDVVSAAVRLVPGVTAYADAAATAGAAAVSLEAPVPGGDAPTGEPDQPDQPDWPDELGWSAGPGSDWPGDDPDESSRW